MHTTHLNGHRALPAKLRARTPLSQCCPARERMLNCTATAQRDQEKSQDVSRRDMLRGTAGAGFAATAARALRFLGAAEFGVAAEKVSISAIEMLTRVAAELRPTAQSLLSKGMRPQDVLRMIQDAANETPVLITKQQLEFGLLQNPALRPRNAAELAKWLP